MELVGDGVVECVFPGPEDGGSWGKRVDALVPSLGTLAGGVKRI